MVNLDKLQKFKRTSIPVEIEYAGQKETFEIKKVTTNNAHLLKFSKDDADATMEQMISKNKELIIYALDITSQEFDEMDVGLAFVFFEKIMEVAFPQSKELSKKEEMLEKIRQKG